MLMHLCKSFLHIRLTLFLPLKLCSSLFSHEPQYLPSQAPPIQDLFLLKKSKATVEPVICDHVSNKTYYSYNLIFSCFLSAFWDQLKHAATHNALRVLVFGMEIIYIYPLLNTQVK